MVCQVVKSKNYRNVSGYVELEFTEKVVGFWGMRFPGDRVGPQPVASVPSPTVPGALAPTSVAPPKPIEFKPAAPAEVKPNLVPSPVAAAPILLEAPVAVVPPVQPPPKQEIAEAPAKPKFEFATPPATTSPQTPASQPAAQGIDTLESLSALLAASVPTEKPQSSKKEALPVQEANSTEALKLETARLQEQLSSLLFAGAPAARPAAPKSVAPVAETKPLENIVAKVTEMAKPEIAPLSPAPVTEIPVAKAPAVPSKYLLDAEEVKIPAWLEPLARNAAAQSTAFAEIHESVPEIAVTHQLADLTEPISDDPSSERPEPPAFGSRILLDESAEQSGQAGSSKKGIVIGAIAAGILLAVAGGAWYFRQGAAAGTAAPVSTAARSTTSPTTPQQQNLTPSVSAPAADPAPAVSSAAVPSQPTSQPASIFNAAARDAFKASPSSVPSAPSQHAVQPAAEPAKKLVLGNVRLASPSVKRNHATQNVAEGEPNFGAGESAGTPENDSLSAGLAGSHPKAPSDPVAPPPVGGDVKAALLVSTVRPVYPTLAKAQHISGDVKIDALIDVTGHVTAMKVISGPTLLHQAAMDSLRQWKYQPASLNGSATATHLAVTIQFRLQ